MVKVQNSKIVKNEHVIQNIYKMVIEFEGDIKAGCFFMLKTLDNSFLLPRPISVNDTDGSYVTFLYRTEGAGTTLISKMKQGDEIQALGPLGNGFDTEAMDGRVAVIGGGIGTAPLLYLVKKLNKTVDVYLGFKDCVYGVEEYEKYGAHVTIVTEDGSSGQEGFVTDHIDYGKYNVVAVCGPEIMMNKVLKSCKTNNVKCYASLERRMACGIGACLGCVAMTEDGNKRVCKDGPVFSGDELILQEVSNG